MNVCKNDLASLQKRTTDHYENWHVNVFLMKKDLCYPLCCSSPPGGATAYPLLHRSINCQVANRVAKNDAILPLSPTFRYVSIESSPSYCKERRCLRILPQKVILT
ncbi:uncharacterized protein TNCV_1522681 [Trichonephila clavipes]|nr:uncharacterized protein TNCV_1522681 [Trichonephila clavipes]